jgi:hypothetical protein
VGAEAGICGYVSSFGQAIGLRSLCGVRYAPYGYAMGLCVPDDPAQPVRTTLMPGMTLFCRQGTRDDAAYLTSLLRSAAHSGDGELPVVMGFDVEQHFGVGSNPWHSDVLSAWIGALGRQAVSQLGGEPRDALQRIA